MTVTKITYKGIRHIHSFFATTAKGLELLLVEELKSLGAQEVHEKLAGVSFMASMAVAYRICIWSRLANRILFTLGTYDAETPEALYQAVRKIRWDEHILPTGSLFVHAVCKQSKINHTLFAAQKVKDAVVDQLREQHGVRPDVKSVQPDASIFLYLYRDKATLSLDLVGESLHKRGYRLEAGAAPLKENLAAGILIRAGWPAITKQGGALYDPMCGSGTLLVEAALIAGQIAPGLLREYFALKHWRQFKPELWAAEIEAAHVERQTNILKLPDIIGYDSDAQAIKMAFANIERAHLRGKIHVEKRDIASFAPQAKHRDGGLIVTNPPYGERLGEVEELKPLYRLLGDRLKSTCVDFEAAIYTSNPELAKQMGIRAHKYYALPNGPLASKLFLFHLTDAAFIDNTEVTENARRIARAKRAALPQACEAALMLMNRIRKKMKAYRRNKTESEQLYRLYDADIPEYAYVIDIASGRAEISEYQAPRFIPQAKLDEKRNAVLALLPEVLELDPEQIFYKGFLTAS